MAVTVADVPAWGWFLVALGGVVLVLAVVSWATAEAAFPLRGKVVVVTGGSSGIGRAVAAAALEAGAHVALVARKPALLAEATEALAPAAKRGGLRVTTHAADVCDDAAMVAAMAAVAAAHGGVIDVVVASAGTSLPKVFEETSAAEWSNLLRLNVVGTRNTVAGALPHMTGAQGGRIVFVSSQAGQVGVYGYTTYSATKFALQGFAQALGQELWNRRIRVSLSFPPDTDTPLLAEENKAKPAITRMLSESTATVPAGVVASGILAGIVHWQPLIAVGFDGWMLATLTSGMGPAGTLGAGLVQVATMGLWRLVALFIVNGWYSTIAKHDKRGGAAPSTSTPLLAAAAPTPASGAAASGSVGEPKAPAAGGALLGVTAEDKRK